MISSRIGIIGTSFLQLLHIGLPIAIAKKFAYTDNLAIVHSMKNKNALKEAVLQDMTTPLSNFFQKYKLKLSTAKTESAFFHRNKRTNHEQRYLFFTCQTNTS